MANGLMDNWRAAASAMGEVDQEITTRLAALELLDPSQKRPTPKLNRTNHGDFMDWESDHELCIQSSTSSEPLDSWEQTLEEGPTDARRQD